MGQKQWADGPEAGAEGGSPATMNPIQSQSVVIRASAESRDKRT